MTAKAYAPIRIVIADDHEIFREGMEVLLKKQPEMELVGDAGNGRQLVDIVSKVAPDIVLTDIKMPVMDGVEAARIIHDKHPHVGIIALSMFEDENLIVDMLEAGARGYLIKNAHKSEVIAAIHSVHNLESYFCNHTSMKLARLIGRSRFSLAKDPVRTAFSKKEREVIELICEEYSNKEIGVKLNLSPRTIEGYREKILEKMNVKNSAGIVVYAIKHGIYKL